MRATPATPPSARAVTSADPTIAPSAYASTSRTWSAVEMPIPTQVRVDASRAARIRATSERAAASTSARAPVIPIVETA